MNTSSSPHILSTSANLLGFTFLVLSSLKSFGLHQGNFLIKIVAFNVMLFALSSFLSFRSMHAKSEGQTKKYEEFAEYVFLIGLVITVILAVFLSFDIMLSTQK